MYYIYKSNNGRIEEINTFEPGCWINMVAPSSQELELMVRQFHVDPSFLNAALDVEEASRIEAEDGQTLIVVDVPTTEKEEQKVIFETLPLGVITTEDCIITVCTKDTSVVNGFVTGQVRNVHTHMKTRFILQILYRVATRFLFYLKQIDRISKNVEKQLHRSLRNKELILLLDLEKSLVFFSTSLKANEITMERMRRGRFVKMYEEDDELMEDVLIETKQAIEMSNIYSSVLSGTMDAFASVISNNLNIVMKVLTSITILMAIPTMISSFYGMNVEGLPVPHFWFPIALSLGITGIAAIFLAKKDMF